MNILLKKKYKEMYKIIRKYDTVILARHVSPDPDAIGSQVALRDSIKLTFPEKKVYAIGAGVSKFKYLGLLDKLDECEDPSDVLLVITDLPNFARLDAPEDLKYDAILKIDHHPKEDIVGDVDWTDDSKSSACEMVADFLIESKMKTDINIAETVFAGMISDSDRFLLSNTSASTFETTSKLLKAHPINIAEIYDNLYERKHSDLKFYAYLIDNIDVSSNSFGSLMIETETLKEYNVDSSTPSHLVNDFHYIKEILAWCFVTYDERNSIYKVNIRSRGPVINTVAAKFNGGGHKFASGCRLKSKEEVEKLFKALDKACAEYLESENK